MNIDVLDKVPMLPGGAYVNHAFYGTVLGASVAGFLLVCGVEPLLSWSYASMLCFTISASKKSYDYDTRGPSQGETAKSCLIKTFLTPLGTWLITLAVAFL